MRPGSYSDSYPSDRPQGRRARSSTEARRSKLRRATLESLEHRTLLSTLPPAIIGRTNLSNPSNATRDNSDESTPSIAVNPLNSQHLVATWTRYDTDDPANTQISVQAAVSFDGGQSWNGLPVPARRTDPSSTATPPTPYPNIDSSSVAFARDGSFYLLTLQHNGVTSGDLILRHYNGLGIELSTQNVYQWNRSATDQSRAKAILHPILAVDNTAPQFTDPTNAAGNVTNPHSGNVYVAYIGETPPPDSPPPNWNPLTVELVSSNDQGLTFGAPLVLNAGGNLGDQRNTRPRIAVSQGTSTTAAGQVTVVWDDYATGATFSPPVSIIRSRQVFNGGQTLGTQATVGTSARVLGNQAGGGTVTGLTANGIGPQPSIAVDNTLGADSPNRGRIYVAFAGRSPTDSPDNPADNTDIYLRASDNGGATWFDLGRVNDDLADRDGFSGAEEVPTFVGPIPSRGRPQFTPEVAVDAGTGTVVVQFYDTRHDAARLRPATYITASIDGGASFGEQVFVNPPETVFDVATGTNRVVGPIPDNQSGGNPNADDLFGFGVRQGLAVLDGRVYSAWSSNINGGTNGDTFLDIRVARATLPSGPRVLDGTGGVVTTTDASGTPQARSFEITFDRPIDPSSFSTNDVTITYRSPTGAAQSITPNNVVQVTSTRFRVEFPGSSSPGTYSYTVGPDIRDRIRSTNVDGTVNTRIGNLMDQDGNAVSDLGQGSDVRFSMPNSRESLPLVVPGPRVVTTRAVRGDGTAVPTSSPVLNDTVVGLEVVFDRDMQANTFTTADVLRIVGPGGEVDRASLAVVPVNAVGGVARTFRITFAKQELSGTYQVVLGPNIQSVTGHLVDSNGNAGVDVLRGGPVSTTVELSFASAQVPRPIPANAVVESALIVDKAFEIADVNVQLNITHFNVPDLKVELVAPGGQTILLFNGVGATGDRSNFTNTILDSQAAQAISAGTPPFSDRYRPQGSLDVLNSAAGVPTPAGTYTLRITNGGSVAGTLNNWRLIMQERVTGTGLGEPVADRIRADFSIFTMDPTNGLSSSTWTPIGPAPIQSGEGAGRVTAIAVDPSDPTGNTVYIGAASGGVWKTNNFLTTAAAGPTWIPLTDAVQANGLNIGGIAVFGRNNDPNQSIVLVSTGEGATGTPGVGFLRSMDGGASWTLLDSADNRVPFAQRGREFVGTTSFKVVADPKPTSTGQAIFYAALSGGQGGLWRSTDSGTTWQRLRAGQATDVILDPSSGTPSVNNPTGNLQFLYVAFRDEGIFISPNQGQQLNLMAGGVGKPRVRDGDSVDSPTIPVADPDRTPTGDKGRIVLAKPALTGDARQDLLYQGWLYAAVATDGNTLDGLYLTKDQGQNWTRLRLPAETTPGQTVDTQYPAIPSNNVGLADYDPTANGEVQLANYALALTIDPTNPHVVYLGGTRNNGGETSLIRVDSTFVHDPHAFYLSSNLPDGGLRRNYASGASVQKGGVYQTESPSPLAFDARIRGTINLYRDPADPFDNTATVFLSGAASFSNTGAGVTWTPFDAAIGQTTDVQEAYSLIDPLTGRGRLIFGVDRGVFTAVDAGNGTVLSSTGLGNTAVVNGSRNGNLQTAQIYYGAAQPSQAAADVAGALFYAQTNANGFPRSAANVLQTGNLNWSSPRLVTEAGSLNGTGVATDPTGSGASYQYNWRNGGDAPKFPSGSGPDFRTDFFLVDLTPGNGDPHDVVGRTSGLLQSSGGIYPDGQWPVPNRNAVTAGAPGGANFAVNPINADQIVISAPGSGRIFRTLDRGLNWLPIGQPNVLGNSYFAAMAFGAPEPGAEPGNIGDYIIGGNNAGQVYVTFTGGGAAGDQWIPLNTGDLAGNTSPVQAIATNPIRGTYEAYLVTAAGVYHIADTRPSSGATWTNVTSDLFQVTHNIFGNEDFEAPLLAADGIRTIAVDWRYAIPNDFDNPPSNPTNPAQTRPVLYVGGFGGVFVSYDDGGAWRRFPSAFPNSLNTTPDVPGDGGGMPVVEVRDLDLSLGNISRATGLPVNQAGDPNLLMASTFGRGAFAIRLAPVVFPDSLRLLFNGERLPINAANPPQVGLSELTFQGFSAQSAAGNTVEIRAYLIGNDGSREPLPLIGGTATTDTAGRFTIRIAPEALGEIGLKRIGIQAVDGAGVAGNIAVYSVITMPTPSTPMLLPADDSGIPGDSLTNIRQPRLTGTMELPPGIAPGSLPLIQLVGSDGTIYGAERVRADGVYVIRINRPLDDGAYVIQARAVDAEGNFSAVLPGLTLRIDTSRPPAVSLGLSPVDDTGSPGDNITSVRRPRLIGSTGAGLRVQLIDVGGNVPGGGPGAVIGGTVISQPTGSFTLQFPSDLPDGTYTVLARVVSDAGNTMESAQLELRILNEVTVGTPTLRLAPESDTGLQGDNRTTDRRPFLIGEADPNSTIEIVGPDGGMLATGIADAQGNYRLRLASNLGNGTIVLRARSRGPSGVAGPLSAPLSLTIESAPGDFNNDGRADFSLYRPGQSAGGSQFLIGSTGGSRVIDSSAFRSNDPTSPLFGFELRPDDLPLTGDFDGDGVADVAVYRTDSDRLPGASEWIILGSRSGPRSVLFGGPGLDVPAVGDFDGDGISDIAVFRPVSDLLPGAAEWFILKSSTGQGVRISFGAAGGFDLPAVGDFDGDGRDDIAVFRPSSDLVPGAAQWFILPSSANDDSFSERLGGYSVLFGAAGSDQPVPADYDGDGKADIATYRPSTSEWFILRSGLPYEVAGLRVPFGLVGDVPAPGDYDNDGIADPTVFRGSTGRWTVRQSTDGADATFDFGADGDVPLLAPLAYRDPRPGSIANPLPAASLALDGGPITQALQVTGVPLDLGGQAAKLSASAGNPTAAAARTQLAEVRAQALADASAARQRVVRGDAGSRASAGLRGFLADFWARRRPDGRPMA